MPWPQSHTPHVRTHPSSAPSTRADCLIAGHILCTCSRPLLFSPHRPPSLTAADPCRLPPPPVPPRQPECCCRVPSAATDASATRQSPAGQEGGARLSCTCIAARGLSPVAMPLLRQTSRDSVALPPHFSPPSAHLCCCPRATTAARGVRGTNVPVYVSSAGQASL